MWLANAGACVVASWEPADALNWHARGRLLPNSERSGDGDKWMACPACTRNEPIRIDHSKHDNIYNMSIEPEMLRSFVVGPWSLILVHTVWVLAVVRAVSFVPFCSLLSFVGSIACIDEWK